MTVRVLIADDQQLVRTGFRLILESEPDIEVVGEAADGQEAVALARQQRPDVALMGIRMPELDGIGATRQLTSRPGDPPTRVLILTTFDLDEYVLDALRAGASGFLLKDAAAGQLAAGVRMVAAGDALLAPTITRRLIEQFAGHQPAAPPPALDELTPRELVIFSSPKPGFGRVLATRPSIGDAAPARSDPREGHMTAFKGVALGGVADAQGAKRAFWGPGDTYTFLVTGEQSGGSMFAMDCVLGPGGGPPPHRHLAEDELFHVYEGEVAFTVEGETHVIAAGQSAFIPKGTAHSYLNATKAEARMLTVYTPAGMEGWFLEVCTPVSDPSLPAPPVTPELIERMLEAGPRHNVEWLL